MSVSYSIYMYADVGAERPADLPHNVRRAQPAVDPQVEGEDDLVQNLEALTQGIRDYGRLANVPRAYQRHIVGVSTHVHHLLRRLVRAVTCYHEHHRD